MDTTIAETAIKAYLKEIHSRLDEAASIAKARKVAVLPMSGLSQDAAQGIP